MKKIKAYTGFSYGSGRHFYQEFTVIDELPIVGEESPFSFDEIVASINPVRLDCEQGNPDVYNHDYYVIETLPKYYMEEDEDPDEYLDEEYICIPNGNDEDEYEDDEEEEE